MYIIGHSRIIRQAYFEDPRYVPLVQRSFELFRKLEVDAGFPLLTMTGGLMIGAPDSPVVLGTLASAKEHQLPHEIFSAPQINEKYPMFNLASHEIGFLMNMPTL